MNDQFPSEINNRCKVLFPILKQQRQKGKWAPFVMDKLYIDGQLLRDPTTTPRLFWMESRQKWSDTQNHASLFAKLFFPSFSISYLFFTLTHMHTSLALTHTDTLCNICPVCWFSVIRFGGLLHLCLINTPIFTTQLVFINLMLHRHTPRSDAV